MLRQTGSKGRARKQKPKLHDVNRTRGQIVFLDPERGGEKGSRK